MMGFTTLCWENLKGLVLKLGLLLMLGLTGPVFAQAERIEVTSFGLQNSSDGDGTVVNADFLLNLGPSLEDVVNRGVPLFFLLEVEVFRPRWYWRDVRMVSTRRGYRIIYNPITRGYRISFGAFAQTYPTLTEALLSMVRIRGWKIAERDVLKRGDSYEAQIRFSLDLAQMPKPFQIHAITHRDWALSTEWKSQTFSP
jgi:hypothetical protein